MDEYWRILTGAISKATANVSVEYFRLAIAGSAAPVVRERAYCYELFHQLREALPEASEFPFVLHGEVDKRGHPLIGAAVGGRNPDFIVHKPRSLSDDANLAVFEVKGCGMLDHDPTKDAESLVAFITRAQYHRGVALIFGGSQKELDDHVQRAFSGAIAYASKISIFWHSKENEAATEILDWSAKCNSSRRA
jgi:hypothetical protein